MIDLNENAGSIPTDAEGGETILIWPAPAKLNLFLHITGRRQDGYHELQTLFQFLDYSDRLGFRLRGDGEIVRRTELTDVSPAADLTVRAAMLLKQISGCEQGADIFIEKRLPMGGGLGGGSSDAATTLVALNSLWGLGFDMAQLSQLGLRLGADVPVFIFGKSAWAEGVGEHLTEVELPPAWYVVIYPRQNVATAELFAAPELTRDARPIKIRDYFAGRAINVFEPLVRRRYPEVDAALKWLSERAQSPAKLTGTGSCVFAVFADPQAAQSVMQEVPEKWQAFYAQGLNRSPLYARG